jgi:hypothetical protein
MREPIGKRWPRTGTNMPHYHPEGSDVIFQKLYRPRRLPFGEVRELVHRFGFQSEEEWREWTDWEWWNPPPNIPKDPDVVYADDWKGFGDWLGTGRFLPYDEAREYTSGLGLKYYEGWVEYLNSGNRPANIPKEPSLFYHDRGWGGWAHWLGYGPKRKHRTERKRRKKVEYRSYPEAVAFVRKLGLSSAKEWHEYVKSGKKPKNIPADPAKVYGKKWKRR